MPAASSVTEMLNERRSTGRVWGNVFLGY